MSITRIELSLEQVKFLMADNTSWVISNETDDKTPTQQYVNKHSCGSIYLTHLSGFNWTPRRVKENKGVFVIEQGDWYTSIYLQIDGSSLKFCLDKDVVGHNMRTWVKEAKDFFENYLSDYYD